MPARRGVHNNLFSICAGLCPTCPKDEGGARLECHRPAVEKESMAAPLFNSIYGCLGQSRVTAEHADAFNGSAFSCEHSEPHLRLPAQTTSISRADRLNTLSEKVVGGMLRNLDATVVPLGQVA
jgi:hypothetical protein